MKRTVHPLLILILMTLLTTAAQAESNLIILSASDAVFESLEGVSLQGTMEPMTYEPDYNLIANVAIGADITFTVPDYMQQGVYDLYMTVSKALGGMPSCPFVFRVNDGRAFSVPVLCPFTATSPGVSDSVTPSQYAPGTPLDKGCALIKTGLELSAGDQIVVTPTFGSGLSNLLPAPSFPLIGDLLLAPAGTAVSVGYDDMPSPTLSVPSPDDPLSGRFIAWLGSSMTSGSSQNGLSYSFANVVQDHHAGTICEKYFVGATSLANNAPDSYISRLKLIPPDREFDLIVVQLSTNDTKTPLGEISDSFDLNSFDDTTVAGAIETIIAYSQETFHCPVAFFTASRFGSMTNSARSLNANYQERVDLLLEIAEKWDVFVIDLFNNEEMTAIVGTELHASFMYNVSHPNLKGYVEWWAPVFEEELTQFFSRNEQ